MMTEVIIGWDLTNESNKEEERYKKWLENLSDVEKIAILIAGFCGIPKDVLDKI